MFGWVRAAWTSPATSAWWLPAGSSQRTARSASRDGQLGGGRGSVLVGDVVKQATGVEIPQALAAHGGVAFSIDRDLPIAGELKQELELLTLAELVPGDTRGVVPMA